MLWCLQSTFLVLKYRLVTIIIARLICAGESQKRRTCCCDWVCRDILGDLVLLWDTLEAHLNWFVHKIFAIWFEYILHLALSSASLKISSTKELDISPDSNISSESVTFFSQVVLIDLPKMNIITNEMRDASWQEDDLSSRIFAC